MNQLSAPEPQTKNDRKARILAVLLLAMMGVSVWIFRDRLFLRQVHNATTVPTPTAEVRSPAAGPVVEQPPVAVGGPVVQPKEGQTGYVGKLTPIVIDALPVDFMRNVVKYCVDQYHPAKTRLNPEEVGRTSLLFKSMNQHFGNDLAQLGVAAKRLEEGRRKFYGFVFADDNIHKLEKAFANQVAEVAIRHARASSRDFELTPGAYADLKLGDAQVAEMLRLTAARIHTFGKCLKGLSATPTLEALVIEYNQGEVSVRSARQAYDKAKGDLALFTDKTGDGIELSGGYKQAMRELIRKRDETLAGVRRETSAREASRRRLAAAVRSASGKLDLDDDELVYMAQWAFWRSELGSGYRDGLDRLSQAAIAVAERLKSAGTKVRSE